MKNFILCISLIKKNIIPIIITALMLTISFFVLSTFYGQYKYISYAKDIMLRSGLDNGVYFMSFNGGEYDTEKAFSIEMQEKIMHYEACEDILLCKNFAVELADGTFINVKPYSQRMRRSFKLPVKKGRWLSDNPERTEIVLTEKAAEGKRLGDTIAFPSGITAEIVGITDDIAFAPSFKVSQNSGQSAQILFSPSDSAAFMTEETISVENLDKIKNLTTDFNFYVVFKEAASEEAINELLSFMQSKAIIVDFDTIISNSDKFIREWLSGAFPLPCFLIIISTIAIICICSVIVKRSMSDYSKYYLLGLSKIKGIVLLSTPQAIIFAVPCILNLLSVLCFPHFLRAGERLATVDYILDMNAAIPILLYMLIITALLFIIPIMFYRKYSPISFYRRNL